jgi:hypothetical protein
MDTNFKSTQTPNWVFTFLSLALKTVKLVMTILFQELVSPRQMQFLIQIYPKCGFVDFLKRLLKVRNFTVQFSYSIF